MGVIASLGAIKDSLVSVKNTICAIPSSLGLTRTTEEVSRMSENDWNFLDAFKMIYFPIHNNSSMRKNIEQDLSALDLKIQELRQKRELLRKATGQTALAEQSLQIQIEEFDDFTSKWTLAMAYDKECAQTKRYSELREETNALFQGFSNYIKIDKDLSEFDAKLKDLKQKCDSLQKNPGETLQGQQYFSDASFLDNQLRSLESEWRTTMKDDPNSAQMQKLNEFRKEVDVYLKMLSKYKNVNEFVVDLSGIGIGIQALKQNYSFLQRNPGETIIGQNCFWEAKRLDALLQSLEIKWGSAMRLDPNSDQTRKYKKFREEINDLLSILNQYKNASLSEFGMYSYSMS